VAVATKSQSKTGFVKKFLQNNPQANSKAVNQAWTNAGMKGTISHPVVSEIRKQLGLAGIQPGKTNTFVKKKAATKMSKAAVSPGKTMFVKEFLNDNPQGNVKAVNDAWQAAGFHGNISKTVVFKVKARLGLTGNLRANTKKSKTAAAGKKQVTPRKETTAAVGVQSDRTVILDDLEADVDRLIFRAMAIGDLTEFEDLLRQARRLLYGALARG
jgi:hypothetical protein